MPVPGDWVLSLNCQYFWCAFPRRNSGFVAFYRRDDAERAKDALSDMTLEGRVIQLMWAKAVKIGDVGGTTGMSVVVPKDVVLIEGSATSSQAKPVAPKPAAPSNRKCKCACRVHWDAAAAAAVILFMLPSPLNAVATCCCRIHCCCCFCVASVAANWDRPPAASTSSSVMPDDAEKIIITVHPSSRL